MDLYEEAQRILQAINEQREEILIAFIAKYGAEPDEVEQVIVDGTRWYVQLKKET
jgi:hypothetical protein